MSKALRYDDDNDPWQEKRRHRRSSVIWPAVVTTPDGERPCTVMNLSLSGARKSLEETI